MPTFVARQQPHRGMVRRSNPTRREPGLLDSIVDPIVSDVVDPVVNKVVSSVVDPVVNSVVKPIATPLLKVASSVVAPIVAPLTQGGNSAPTQASQPPPPANTPPPGTAPPGGSSGGGSGNGNGNSGGGNNGSEHSGGNENGNNGGSGNGNSGGGGSGSSGGNGGGSGTGGGSESGNGNGNGGGTGDDNGSGSEAGPVNNSSNGGVPGSGNDNSDGVSGTGSGQTPTDTGDSAASSGSDFHTTGGNVPANAGGDPNVAAPDGSTSGHGDGSVTDSTAFNPGPSGSGGNGNNGNGVEGGSTDGAGGMSGQKGGLSGGAIAGIVVGVLLAVAIVLIIMIRRQRKRSKARQQQSWFARNGASPVYNDGAQFDTVVGHNGVRRSVRSSFETTVDHSQTPRLELDFEQVPDLPPMAQLRGDPVLVNLDTAAIGLQDAVTSQNSPTMSRRFSIATATSSIGDGDGSQWLTVNPRMGLGGGQNSPMSVRLSSPVEAFAFPRPPTDVSGSDYSSLTIASPSAKSGIQEMPSLPVPSLAVNPFDDPSPSVASASAGKARKIPKPIDVVAANPFADPSPNLPIEPNTPSAVHPEFQVVEMIRRPFVPTLSDEVMVEVGDKVKILQMFDDGWSLVEKNPVLSMDSKETDKSPQVGLIPIDCLRSVGLDVNEFIASKRVSSYSEKSSRRDTLDPGTNSSGGVAF